MLSSNTAVATIAVKDMTAADAFYSGVLGFKKTEKSGEDMATYESGDGELFVYESEFAGTCKSTIATWPVFEIEDVVEELKGQGISFEHFNMPGTKRKGDIHECGDIKAAWFKDPDGNILCLVEN